MRRNWKHNVYFLIILIGYFIVYRWISRALYEKSIRLDLNPLVSMIIGFFLYILFGILLGILHLIKEFRHEGKWKFDIQRFIILGIPALIFSLSLFLYIIIPLNTKKLFGMFILTSGKNSLTLVQILFGYIVTTCFYRLKDSDKEDIS